MAHEGSDKRATLRTIFEAAQDPDLSAEQLRLWLLYRAHEFHDGRGAFPGEERLARMMDRSPRSVQRHRTSLVEAGYLEQKLRGPKPALYRAVLPDGQPEPDKGEGDAPAWPTAGTLDKSASGAFDYPDAFEDIWSAYPRRKGKKAAYAKVRARVNEGVAPDRLERAARLYAREMDREDREDRFIKLPATFFGPKDAWREQLQDGASVDGRRGRPDRRKVLSQYDGDDGE